MKTIKMTIEELDKLIEEELERLLIEGDLKRQGYNIRIEQVDGTILDFEDTTDAKEWRLEQAKLKAIKGFQAYYRKLSTNQRYELTKWLKKVLLKELNLDEIQEITSKIISASQGLSKRKNPLQKPK